MLSYNCEYWSQWEGGGNVNYDLWLSVLHCETNVGTWNPNFNTGSMWTWSAWWQESNTQTDRIWQHETRPGTSVQQSRAQRISWEASSGMKRQYFIDVRNISNRFRITSVHLRHRAALQFQMYVQYRKSKLSTLI